MKSKNFFQSEATAESRFSEGLAGVQAYCDTLPVVSKSDKAGNNLYKSVISLLPTAIEVAPKLKNYLRGGFELDNLINNKATLENLAAKVSALEAEKRRLNAAIACVTTHVDKDYREIYAAAKDAADDDVSLQATCDKLGEPYKKTSSAAETPAAAPATPSPLPAA